MVREASEDHAALSLPKPKTPEKMRSPQKAALTSSVATDDAPKPKIAPLGDGSAAARPSTKRGRPPSMPKLAQPPVGKPTTPKKGAPAANHACSALSTEWERERRLLSREVVCEAQTAAELELENAALREAVDRLRGAERMRELASQHSAQVPLFSSLVPRTSLSLSLSHPSSSPSRICTLPLAPLPYLAHLSPAFCISPLLSRHTVCGSQCEWLGGADDVVSAMHSTNKSTEPHGRLG